MLGKKLDILEARLRMNNEYFINFINDRYKTYEDDTMKSKFPISYDSLKDDIKLIDFCIDFIGDILQIRGFDIDWNTTKEGDELERTIDFLVRLKG